MSEGISREGALTAKFMNEIGRLKSELASVRGECDQLQQNKLMFEDLLHQNDQLRDEVERLKLNATSLIRIPSASGRSDRVLCGITLERERDALKESLKLAFVAIELACYHHQGMHGIGHDFREARDKLLERHEWLSDG